MTNALQVLYSAEYFLRRQLSGEGDSGPTGYAYNNGDTQYDEFINNDNNNYNDSLYSSTLSPQEQSTIMEGDPHNNNNNNNSSHSQGRTVLTILYLCVLGLCFVVPVFYYFRLHCFEEHARREMELDFAAALEHSEQNRDEARAARRKYIDERRARILQLLGPVRMILRKEHFPHLVDPDKSRLSVPSGGIRPDKVVDFPEGPSSEFDYGEGKPHNISRSDESATMASDGVFSPCTSDDDDDDVDDDNSHQRLSHHPEPSDTSIISDGNVTENNEDDTEEAEDSMEKGIVRSTSHAEEEEETHAEDNDDNNNNNNSNKNNAGEENDHNCDNQRKNKTSLQHNPYGDEDSIIIKIPVPGLPLDGSSLLDPTKPQHDGIGASSRDDREMRLAPGLCTICLSNYQVGSDIVWSSNEACDHHFHASCIEKWLMKQREGPLCPCCRRDFIVDPFDLLEEEANRNDDIAGESSGTGIPTTLQWDPAFLGLEDEIPRDATTIDLGPVVAGTQYDSEDETVTDIEEGLGLNSSISDARAVLSGGDSDLYELALMEENDAPNTSRSDVSA